MVCRPRGTVVFRPFRQQLRGTIVISPWSSWALCLRTISRLHFTGMRTAVLVLWSSSTVIRLVRGTTTVVVVSLHVERLLIEAQLIAILHVRTTGRISTFVATVLLPDGELTGVSPAVAQHQADPHRDTGVSVDQAMDLRHDVVVVDRQEAQLSLGVQQSTGDRRGSVVTVLPQEDSTNSRPFWELIIRGTVVTSPWSRLATSSEISSIIRRHTCSSILVSMMQQSRPRP